MIRFYLNHPVMPKQADRTRIITAKSGQQFIGHYQPKELVHNANALMMLMRMFVPAEPMTGPVQITLTFMLPWRASELKRDKERGLAFASTKPDWDNLCKQLCDAMQEAGFFLNDSQIAWTTIIKARTSVEKTDPNIDVQGVHVMIEPADEMDLVEHFNQHIWEPITPEP